MMPPVPVFLHLPQELPLAGSGGPGLLGVFALAEPHALAVLVHAVLRAAHQPQVVLVALTGPGHGCGHVVPLVGRPRLHLALLDDPEAEPQHGPAEAVLLRHAVVCAGVLPLKRADKQAQLGPHHPLVQLHL